MKNSIFGLIMILGLLACGNAGEEKNEEDESQESLETLAEEENIPSPRKEARGKIENVTIVVDYGSPAVKGREIWGGLEEYGKVWRAGANATTSISFDQDVLINGQNLPAGKYAFFLIPEKEQWTVIFNKDWDEWGAFNYDEAQDVLRLNVTPRWVDENQERLTYSISDSTLNFAWEKVRISLDIDPGNNLNNSSINADS